MLLFMCRYSLNGSAYLDIFYGICNVICTYIYIYMCVCVLGVSVSVGHPKRLSHKDYKYLLVNLLYI